MTEAEWLACEDPRPMLKFIAGWGRDRKLRLFQVACCRRAWALMPDEVWRDAVTVAERYADQQANDKMRIAAIKNVQSLPLSDIVAVNAIYAALEANRKTMDRRRFTSYGVPGVFGHAARQAEPNRDDYRAAFKSEQQVESQLVRDIFGNPFRAITLNPAWRTSDGLALARGIYAEKAFDRMPILADALQDAGCDNTDILNHCRDANQVHVRGCWVVDLVLGKS